MTPTRVRDARARTVFLGSGPFGGPTLGMLAEHPAIELVGVVSAPPRPVGRGRVLTATSIGGRAAVLGIEPILGPIRLREPAAIAEVLALQPDLAVLADYGQLVPGALLDLPHGALNLHPSLLPRHRGATPIPAAILAGDQETGVTLIRMDAGLDSGPILAREVLTLDGTETAPRLELILADIAAVLLADCLEPWLEGEITPAAQDGSISTLTRPLRREDGRLDPGLPAARLERQVRAFSPWPGTFIDTSLGRIVVLDAAVVEGERGAPAGRLDPMGMTTADGRRLAFGSVRPAGGRTMAWADLLRGRPGLVGTEVGSGA